MSQLRPTHRKKREAAEKRRKLSLDLAVQIEERCKQHQIPVEVIKAPVGAMVQLELASGRDRRKIFVGGAERLQRLVHVPFEDYVILSELLALCIYEEDVIEGLVESAGNAPARQILHRRLEDEEGKIPSPLLGLTDRDITITLGSPSKAMQALLVRRTGTQEPLALRIKGIAIDRHDDAKVTLEKVANSLFLEVDTAFGVPLLLSRVRSFHSTADRARKGQMGSGSRQVSTTPRRCPCTGMGGGL